MTKQRKRLKDHIYRIHTWSSACNS